MSKSTAEILFEKHLNELGIHFMREGTFHPSRKWRWDFVLNQSEFPMTAIEIQGGFYKGKGGHNSITGMQRDMDKRNHGTALGWRIYTFSTADVLRGRAKAFLAEHLK